MTPKRLPIASIATDLGTQSRAATDGYTVDCYAESMTGGEDLPPVVVFFDGARHILADGFHRLLAARKADFLEIDCIVHLGTLRDAVLYAAKANATHGRPRTNADKRHVVSMLLSDETWAQWSDREIGRACMVSNTFVSNMRRERTSSAPPDSKPSSKRRGADGRVTDTSRIGKGRKSTPANSQGPKDEDEERHADVDSDPVAERIQRIRTAESTRRDEYDNRDYTSICSRVMLMPVNQLESLHTLIGNLLRSKRTG